MRLFFICAKAVAVNADWYAHFCMKPPGKIRIVYADMRIFAYAEKTHICSYEKSTQVCHPIRLMIFKIFENVPWQGLCKLWVFIQADMVNERGSKALKYSHLRACANPGIRFLRIPGSGFWRDPGISWDPAGACSRQAAMIRVGCLEVLSRVASRSYRGLPRSPIKGGLQVSCAGCLYVQWNKLWDPNFQFQVFFYPSDRNERYHTPLLSKI